MADSIIPLDSLARATAADLARSNLYLRPTSWIGRASDPDQIVVYERHDGGFDSFSLASLRESPWWRLGVPDDVLRIEYLMRPARSWSESFGDTPVSYVARSDRRAGRQLITGSRLSEYFDGEVGYEAAKAACTALRASWPDADVFVAAHIEEAELMLQGVDVHAAKLERRKHEIRAEKDAALARLETMK